MLKPLKEMKVTSPFGPRKAPLVGATTYHSGIDLSASVGTKCYAISDGVVKVARNYPQGIGMYVVIQHDTFCTTYGHLSDFIVKEGQLVKEGDVIALSGNTGNSTGPHLHFEVRLAEYDSNYWTKYGNYYKDSVNPIAFLEEFEKPNKYRIALEQIQEILRGVL